MMSRDITSIVERLKSIKRYNLYAGSLDPYTSCVGEDETESGGWIKAEDIDSLVSELNADTLSHA